MTETATPSRVTVCGIGASAGGVEALQHFFTALAPDLGLAYVVVVHLSPDHKSELPAILGRWTTMPVLQVGDHEKKPLRPDHVYVIAPDRTLEITDSSVGASRFQQPRGQRTAIDLFFRSLAVTHGDGFVVVLSGSGSDGALGARAVKESGGLILVQDPGEAMHGSMPRAVIATGVADVVLPVRELAVRLGELARIKQRMPRLDSAVEDGAAAPADEDKALKGVLEVLRKRTGHDFSKYKRSTVLRRLARRMQLAHQHTIHEYLKFLRASVSEPQALLNDLLISVTMFFRDTEAWTALQAQRHRAARRAVRPRRAAAGLGARLRDRGRGVQRRDTVLRGVRAAETAAGLHRVRIGRRRERAGRGARGACIRTRSAPTCPSRGSSGISGPRTITTG